MGLREVYAAEMDAAKKGTPFSPMPGITVWLRPDWAPEFQRLRNEHAVRYEQYDKLPWHEWPEHIQGEIDCDKVAVMVMAWEGEALPCTPDNVRALAKEIIPFRVALLEEFARRQRLRQHRATDLGNDSPRPSSAASVSPTARRSSRRSSSKDGTSPTN